MNFEWDGRENTHNPAHVSYIMDGGNICLKEREFIHAC